MNVRSWGLVLFFAGSSFAVGQEASDARSPVTKVARSIAHIEAIRGDSLGEIAGSESGTDRGSAFAIEAGGYLVTLATLIADAKRIVATPLGGSPIPATVIGVDRFTGIALLRVDAELAPVTIGDISRLDAGQRLMMVGSALPGTTTVADGIVSHHGGLRVNSPPSELLVAPYIAVTVPIHPGNGGAPLVDLKGDVVGMTVSVYSSRREVTAPVMLAVPIDVISHVASSLRHKGYVPRGSIQIVVQQVTADLAIALGLDRPRGALVNRVLSNGPAERSGLRSTDVILEFDGRTVRSSSDIPLLVQTARPGTRVLLKVWRNGRTNDITVDIEESKAERSPRPK